MEIRKIGPRFMKVIGAARKIAFLFSIISFACVGNRTKIDKRIENGIEVVINHRAPYSIKGELSTFTLNEKMFISQERLDLLEKGMMSMGEFDVDDEGNIYIVGPRNRENFIYKFDEEGNYVLSFARRGQGPGELEMPFRPIVVGDNIAITDRAKKLAIYSKEGKLIMERRFNERVASVDMLENGNLIFYGWLSGPKQYAMNSLSLFDSSFRKIGDLDTHILDYMDTKYPNYFMWRVASGRIYIINEERGYEILVCDFEGNIIKKIRKEYTPISPTSDIKKLVMGRHYIEGSEYVPDPLPPIKLFFTDDKARLFVMTYEQGDSPGEYIYDIFNPEGIFIGRKSLKLPWVGRYFGPKYEMMKKNRFYCYREKEDGFRELVMYEVCWK